MTKVAIMLGGNLPGTSDAMKKAVEKFDRHGFTVLNKSRIFHSAAVDCVPDTPDFLDQALTGEWAGTPRELLELCQTIETEAGRPEIHSSRESRILDCDIILFGEIFLNTPALTIPHPRARERMFVLVPLAEIAPEWRFPDQITVAQALRALSARC